MERPRPERSHGRKSMEYLMLCYVAGVIVFGLVVFTTW
jgi:hypothetical protein